MQLDVSLFTFGLLVHALVQVAMASTSRPRRNDETMYLSAHVREMFRPLILTDSDLADDTLTPWVENQGEGSLPEFRRACPSSMFMRYNAQRIPAITFEKHCSQLQCGALGDGSGLVQADTRSLYGGYPEARMLLVLTHSELYALKRKKWKENVEKKRSHVSPPMCRPIAYYRCVKVMYLREDGRRRTMRRLLEIPVGCSCSADPLRV
ncbi:hypothetical protein EGW08_013043 [Elysia chlorotica]|uniref:TGF-beta family profile domain-containing protein n=1 Tax=Elysia chlorotica TaxID=188477 RepID=A0A433TC69_ELYCH|nr:hypothetical protein EGW08_013043 [Elysia chlorotica]